MKKTLLSLLLAAALMAPVAVSANTTEAPTTTEKQCKKEDCKKEDCKKDKKDCNKDCKKGGKDAKDCKMNKDCKKGDKDAKDCKMNKDCKKGGKDVKDCKMNKDCKKGDAPEGARGPRMRESRESVAARMQMKPYEGIPNLTESQKDLLKQIPMPGKCMMAENDSVQACPETKVDPSVARADYLNKVRAILTPDQYISFLENMIINGSQMHKGQAPRVFKGDSKCKEDGKKGCPEMRGKRPDKNAKPGKPTPAQAKPMR